jgi:pyruvate dehydrogenase complex dihydrolipoamide acetyltransferase long form
VAVEVKMPKLGMTMEQGKIVEWSKKDQERVEQGEILLVIESDKVTYEVESPGSGILAILIEGGEEIPVGTLLGYLAVSQAEYADIKGQPAAAAPTAAATQEATSRPAAPAAAAMGAAGRVRATPGARKLAREKGLDLARISGTGPMGRVTREDVFKAAARPAAPSPAVEPVAEAVGSAHGLKRLLREEPMSGMRATIARRMLESLQNTAQMTAFSEWDVTELMRLRSMINREEQRLGFRATIPGLMVALLGRVLKEMPLFNASVEGNTIKYWEDVNVGVAVALPDGLLVPVVHGVQDKSLRDIQRILADLIQRARAKKLLPDEMTGGTFTLTNIGSYGGEWETIIINPPEVAILAIGNSTRKPVVANEQIVIREMMPISLTVDHRIIDGAASGAFRRRMKELVENPGLLIAC